MPLTTLFISTLFIFLFIGTLWSPICGIVAYLAVYIIYNPNIWWGSVIAGYLPRPSFVAMIFLFISCLLHQDKLDWSISRREIEFYLFLAAAWIVSLGFGVEMHEGAWNYLQKMVKIFVFIFVLLRIVNSLPSYKLVIWTLIIGGIFLAWQAPLVGYFTGGRLDNIGGIDFCEANGFASFLTFGIIFLGFKMLHASFWEKALYVTAIALMLNAIIMTQSRAVFLGMGMACLFILLRVPAGYRKQIYLYAALGVILFFILADVKFWDRMDTINGQVRINQFQTAVTEKKELSRIDFWRASIRMFIDHPMGVGVKNFEKLVPHYDFRNRGMDAHNTYVLCYSEIGIFGIVLFIVIIIEALFQLKRVGRMVRGTPHEQEITIQALSLNAVLIIYLFGQMVTHSILYHEFFWILLAMPICLENATCKLLDSS